MPLHLPLLCGYCSAVFYSMPTVAFGLQSPWGMDVVFCLDHFTCCKATHTISFSKCRGTIAFKIEIVRAVKIYVCEIVFFAVYCGAGRRENYHLKHLPRHI